MAKIKQKIISAGKKALCTAGAIGALALPQKTEGANPVDITVFQRKLPYHYFKTVYDFDRTKHLFYSVPFGEHNNTYLWWREDSDNNGSFLEWSSTITLENLSIGTVIRGIWKDEEESELSTKITADLGIKRFGLAGVVDLDEPKRTMLGARATLGNFTAYFATGIEEFEPKVGLSYKGPITVDVAYLGEKGWQLRVSKAFNALGGKLNPEIRTHLSKDEEFSVGFGVGYIPGGKK